MKRILLLAIIAALGLSSCSKTNDLPEGLGMKGNFYPYTSARGTPCAGSRIYSIAAAKATTVMVTVDFTTDTLKTGGTYWIAVNKWDDGWKMDSAILRNVVYTAGMLSAQWAGGYLKNVFVTEQ